MESESSQDTAESAKRNTQGLYSESGFMPLLIKQVTEHLTQNLGFKSNLQYSIIRIILNCICCTIGLTAAILPFDKLQSTWMRQLVPAFFGTLVIVFLFDYFVVQSCFSVFYNKEGESIRCSVQFDMSTGKLNLKLQSKSNELKLEEGIERYFDSDGYLVEKNLNKDISALITKKEGKKKKDIGKKKKKKN